MRLNQAKCTFRVEDSQFLGHIIGATGIRANPKKIEVVIDMKPPKNLAEVQSLNGKLVDLIIMEYLVKIRKKARILKLKRRHLKITVLTSNTPYPSRKIRRIRACTSQKTTKETRSIHRIHGGPIRRIQAIEIIYYGRYQTLRKEKEEAQQQKFLENLKQLHISFPFIEALAQMLKYAKFLKGLLTNKDRNEEACMITMNERCSAVLLNKLPSKEKDPMSFTIPCDINQLHINNVLPDLGASISLMPYTMYEKLGLGEPKATRMSLELVDRSIQYPRGIIENVLIKVNKFVLPIDFVILDMLKDSRVHIILGRPFLATARAMIDVFNKKITLRVLDKCKGAFAWKMSDIKGIRFFKILIAPKDQENTSFTYPYGTFAYRRMPFGLCNALATFQRCMTVIFRDKVEDFMKVFMDEFLVFGNSFNCCLANLDRMLARCEETNLVLNWKKCHFMVKEGIVLGHKISGAGIEVDRAKIDVIAKLPYPKNVKEVRSFLGHAGFYRRFIKDISMISKSMTQLLMKDAKFDFSDDCKKAFNILKEKLTFVPVIISLAWNVPFELMFDTSDFAVGAVLGQ
uniref:Reverse transcriptase domain-containing protein n=1 Tax=Tanacetum cinerariifolium TaxID=118510 RepID=A0A6L2MKX6_TANCI|nr:reverse transcriptase domain-containing protein [Tanacetum cinerariifolium]